MPEKQAVPVTVGQPGGPVEGVLDVVEGKAAVLLGLGAIMENE